MVTNKVVFIFNYYIFKLKLDNCITVFDVVSSPKRQTFFQIRGELDNGNFFYFTTFFKRVTGGLFDYNGIVSKEENNLVHSKFEGVIFTYNFY